MLQSFSLLSHPGYLAWSQRSAVTRASSSLVEQLGD
jgi:hypothetical protein